LHKSLHLKHKSLHLKTSKQLIYNGLWLSKTLKTLKTLKTTTMRARETIWRPIRRRFFEKGEKRKNHIIQN